jgi:hypothetical protein
VTFTDLIVDILLVAVDGWDGWFLNINWLLISRSLDESCYWLILRG